MEGEAEAEDLEFITESTARGDRRGDEEARMMEDSEGLSPIRAALSSNEYNSKHLNLLNGFLVFLLGLH